MMVALRQTPIICSRDMQGSPLQNGHSWADCGGSRQLDGAPIAQAPPSPVSRHSHMSHMSQMPTYGTITSDSDMLDFIPALALPTQAESMSRRIVSAAAISTAHVALQEYSPVMDGAAAVSAPECRASTAQQPGSLQDDAVGQSGAPAARHVSSGKPGSSTDTLPGPPTTPFSTSDSEAMGPTTPSNSFAQVSARSRPAYLTGQPVRPQCTLTSHPVHVSVSDVNVDTSHSLRHHRVLHVWSANRISGAAQRCCAISVWPQTA